MAKDSADEQAAQSFTGETLDCWSWIGRARAAARRAVEGDMPPEPAGERAASAPEPGDD